MSGAWTRIYAMYVRAGLCPHGCGDTMTEVTQNNNPATGSFDVASRCPDCDWLGPSRARAEKILTPSPLPATREEPIFNAIPADLPEGVSFILAPERLPNETAQQFARRCVVGREQVEPATRAEQ